MCNMARSEDPDEMSTKCVISSEFALFAIKEKIARDINTK